MRVERGFGEYFKYSLHDARILKMEHMKIEQKILIKRRLSLKK